MQGAQDQMRATPFSGAREEKAERVTVWIAQDTHVLLRLVLLQRRAQGAGPRGLRFQIVDLQIKVRLHLLGACSWGPDRGRVVRLPLETETGTLLSRSPQPDPLGPPFRLLPCQQSAIEVGQGGRIGRTENNGTEGRRHVLHLAPTPDPMHLMQPCAAPGPVRAGGGGQRAAAAFRGAGVGGGQRGIRMFLPP